MAIIFITVSYPTLSINTPAIIAPKNAPDYSTVCIILDANSEDIYELLTIYELYVLYTLKVKIFTTPNQSILLLFLGVG